jgi:putative tricarboxylic transport membrane protein
MASEGGGRRVALGDLVIAAALAALGIFMLWEVSAFPVSPGYARVGPRVFPVLVGAGLIALGFWLAWEAWRSQAPSDAGEPPVHWAAFFWVLAGLLAEAALLERIGFVLAATLLFVMTARGFGSRRLPLDAAVGLVVAVIAYIGFTRGLGLGIPAGPLSFLQGG